MNVQHTYRIRHRGVESTPYTIGDLRQMWKAGQIDATTEFRRGDSGVWLDANDLRPELEFEDAPPVRLAIAAEPAKAAGLNFHGLTPVSPQSVRLTSVRIPFREIFVVVLKICVALVIVALLAATGWMALVRFLP